MAKTETPSSATREAATSSCVESGLDAQRTRSAPPAASVRARLAVSLVTCRQADSRIPWSGFSLAKRSRICRRTGMLFSAHSIRSRPRPASAWSLMSKRCAVWTEFPIFLASCHDGRLDARRARKIGRRVGRLPGELGQVSPEVAEGRGRLVDRTPQVQLVDDPPGRQREVLANQVHEPPFGLSL